MSGLLRSMGAALLAACLSGCVTYPPEYYYPGDAQGGSAYYYGERYEDGYGYDGGYVEEPYGGGYSAGWPAYYSTLWPVYRNYYDPYWSPGFYYGVTWFPSTYFGIGIGGWDAWPYYTPYSPYPYAFWDNYYAWYDPWYYGGYYGHGHGHWDDDDWDDDDDHGHGGGNHGGNGGWRDPPQGGNGPRFGSARNEAERLASLSGAGAQSQAGKYGATGDATGRFAGRNWRGTPPQGALSQSGSAGRAPVSNADLYGGGRFASRPGAMPAGAAPTGNGGYRDDARTGYVPGGSAGGARGESQRMGVAPTSPAGDRGNAYSAPRGSVPQATNPNAGYVGPAPRSRPTGNQDWRRYDQGAQPDANAAAPRSYSRQLPQEGYAPIQGSAGGSSRWRSAPPSAPAPDSRGYVAIAATCRASRRRRRRATTACRRARRCRATRRARRAIRHRRSSSATRRRRRTTRRRRRRSRASSRSRATRRRRRRASPRATMAPAMAAVDSATVAARATAAAAHAANRAASRAAGAIARTSGPRK